MPPISRNKYTDEDDRLMWKYFISRLRKNDPACEHPSLQFWEDFREKYNWDRAVSGIESHFRKQLKCNIHKSGLRDRYLFTAMKKFKTQLNLMDFDELERKHDCIIYKTDNMIFKKAMRGDTEISKLPTAFDDDENEEMVINPRREHVFEISSDSDSSYQQVTPAQTAQQTNAQQTSANQQLITLINQPTTNPFTQMRLNWQRNSMPAALNNVPTTSSTLTPSKNVTLRKKPATIATPTKATPSKTVVIKQSPHTDTPVASRTRSSAAVFFNSIQVVPTPTGKRAARNLNKTPSKTNSSQPSTSRANQSAELADVKAALIEQMQKVLSGKLEAKKLDDHPLLRGQNISGFEKMLEQQKLVLAVLMSDNNQLRFFDQDYKPSFQKQKLIPMPKIIKLERPESQNTDNVESVDAEQLIYAYDSSIE
ncbi:hypothetical protein M3Y97_00479500 [Aphelenchoides bicaudatus]|nr:hypothetical protein M3Y97_00479500 [Aphelenchoides bicaudatus]